MSLVAMPVCLRPPASAPGISLAWMGDDVRMSFSPVACPNTLAQTRQHRYRAPTRYRALRLNAVLVQVMGAKEAGMKGFALGMGKGVGAAVALPLGGTVAGLVQVCQAQSLLA